MGYVRKYFFTSFLCHSIWDWMARSWEYSRHSISFGTKYGSLLKGCCIQQSLLPDDVPCSSNSLNPNVPTTQKPANRFAEQISCLVSIWCQLWRIWVKLLKNTLDLFFYVKDLVTISSNFGSNNIFSLSLNASEFSFSVILTFSLSLINDIKILNLFI